MSLGMRFISSALLTGDPADFFNKRLLESDLSVTEQEVYGYITEHFQKYKAFPSVSLVESDTGEELPQPDEVPAYYLDHIKNRSLTKHLNKMVIDVKEQLSSANKDPKKALDLVIEHIVAAQSTQFMGDLLDLRNLSTIIKDEYIKTLTMGDEYGIRLGWKAVDEDMGGAMPGDVISYVGRPAMGKTFNLLYSMHHTWVHQAQRPMFISMEMLPIVLGQRMAAIHSKKSLTKIKTAKLSTQDMEIMMERLAMLADIPNPAWIFDANLASTVEDIWRLCVQYRPTVLFIDGAYMLKHPNPRISKFERVGQNIEMIKQNIATSLGIPCILSYQFNREAAKLKKGQAAGVEHIAFADEIGQISTLVLGLLEDDSVETLQRRKVSILKGRGGEVGDFYINWDFVGMDFSQWEGESVEDLNDD